MSGRRSKYLQKKGQAPYTSNESVDFFFIPSFFKFFISGLLKIMKFQRKKEQYFVVSIANKQRCCRWNDRLWITAASKHAQNQYKYFVLTFCLHTFFDYWNEISLEISSMLCNSRIVNLFSQKSIFVTCKAIESLSQNHSSTEYSN